MDSESQKSKTSRLREWFTRKDKRAGAYNFNEFSGQLLHSFLSILFLLELCLVLDTVFLLQMKVRMKAMTA